MFEDLIARAPEGTTCLTTNEYDRALEKAINDQRGTLGGDCAICGNKGFVLTVRDGVRTARECECMAKRRNAKRAQASGLEDVLNRYTFDNYQADEAWQGIALDKAKRYATEDQGWFVIVGNAGTGKTHLCTAICGELMRRGQEVFYMLWREEAPRLKAMVNDRAEYDSRMDVLKRIPVLYIDDFWKGTVTDADVNLSFELLNARYNDKRKRTIISGEKTIEDILRVDEAIGSRIYECSAGFRVKTSGKNWRLK